MIRNHEMFGNTSIIFIVGKVILIINYAQQFAMCCLGNHFFTWIISHGHVT